MPLRTRLAVGEGCGETFVGWGRAVPGPAAVERDCALEWAGASALVLGPLWLGGVSLRIERRCRRLRGSPVVVASRTTYPIFPPYRLACFLLHPALSISRTALVSTRHRSGGHLQPALVAARTPEWCQKAYVGTQSSSVSSQVSESAAIPACIAASSPYTAAISSKVQPLRSTESVIQFPFLVAGLAQTDDTAIRFPDSVHHEVQMTVKAAYGRDSAFAMPVAGDGDRVVPIEALNVGEVYAVLDQVELVLGIVSFIGHGISKRAFPRPARWT